MFRIADALSRFGVADRITECGSMVPSPHLSYFHPDALKRSRYGGIRRGGSRHANSIRRCGLWDRLRFDRAVSWPFAALAWVALTAASPVVPCFQPTFRCNLPGASKRVNDCQRECTVRIHNVVDRGCGA